MISTGAGINIAFIIGGFFGTINHSWDFFLLYSSMLLALSIYYEIKDAKRSLSEVKK